MRLRIYGDTWLGRRVRCVAFWFTYLHRSYRGGGDSFVCGCVRSSGVGLVGMMLCSTRYLRIWFSLGSRAESCHLVRAFVATSTDASRVNRGVVIFWF